MEKYPNKRGYAVGKLQKFLAKYNLTKEFRENCDFKGNKKISGAFYWNDSEKGHNYWSEIHHRFVRYSRGELDD